jgi:hypothetical protein
VMAASRRARRFLPRERQPPNAACSEVRDHAGHEVTR